MRWIGQTACALQRALRCNNRFGKAACGEIEERRQPLDLRVLFNATTIFRVLPILDSAESYKRDGGRRDEESMCPWLALSLQTAQGQGRRPCRPNGAKLVRVPLQRAEAVLKQVWVKIS